MFSFWQRHLDPVDILSEAIYGVLIVMTFTMAARVLNPELLARPIATDMVHSLFLAAFGCAIAWGFIDGVIYMLTSLAERGQARRVVRQIQAADNQKQAVAGVADLLDDHLVQFVSPEERARLAGAVVRSLAGRKTPEVWLEREDWLGAVALFSVAFISTMPVVLPLLLVKDPFFALRLSNLFSIVYLYLIGYWWARYAGARSARTGFMVALTGTLLVLIAIPLGG